MSTQLEINLQNAVSQKEEFLIPSNIRENVTIFGVTGILSASLDPSDATALATDIISGKTAYTALGKVTGTIREVKNNESTDVRLMTNDSSHSQLIASFNQPDTTLRQGASQTIPYSLVVSAIGLTGSQIVAGNTILGIAGTATTDSGVGIIHSTSELPMVANEGDVRVHVNALMTEFYGIYVYTNYEWVLQTFTNIMLEPDYTRAVATTEEIMGSNE